MELDDVEEIRNVMSDREDWRTMKSGRMKIRHKKNIYIYILNKCKIK